MGNGEFAFTADITGLQTFPEKYEQGIPLCTQSQWGWHSIPAPAGLRAADLVLTPYDTHGRQVRYATGQDGQRPLFNWLRENPHRLNLGRIGLALKRADGSAGRWEDVTGIDQQLDLWTGVLRSRFQFEGESVVVETMCHPESDTVAVVVESGLIARGLLAVDLAFPYGSPAINASDWLAAAKHVTELNGRVLRRRLDGTEYWVALEYAEGVASMSGAHVCRVSPRAGASRLSLACRFTRSAPSGATPAAGQVRAASVAHWQRFWSSGGAIDFSQCQDSRAVELGRRAVLSQYLTAIQCAGSLPPQETGPDVQQLVRQVSPGDALVACGALCLLEPGAVAGEEPGLLFGDPAGGAGAGQAAGLPGRAVAQDGGAGGAGQSIQHRAAADLAATTSRLLRGALLLRAPGCRDVGPVPRRRV